MPEERGHGSGRFLAGPGHGFAAGDHELDPVVEPESAAGHQRGVLAEAVAGTGGRREPDALDGVEDDQAEHGGGQLGVLGLGQLLDRRLQQQVGQVAIRGRRSFFDDLPRRVVDPRFTHSGAL